MATLNITLCNRTTSDRVFAHITGTSVDSSKGSICFMKSDGQTPCYSSNPTSDLTPVTEDIAIPLGAPNSSSPVKVTIPQLSSGRIYFSVDKPLTFFLNKGPVGPALVQPSVTNPNDPNFNTFWTFCEFTFNGDGLFGNISYVDFVAFPIAMSLTNSEGKKQEVFGMKGTGLKTVCQKLQEQSKVDAAPWDQLIFPNADDPIRVLSPYNAMVMDGSKFSMYWEKYIDQVWDQYQNDTLAIDTQGSPGILEGKVINDIFTFACEGGSFSKPTSADVFSCNTGPFGGLGNTTPGNIAARLCAALNRTTLHANPHQPHQENVETYYAMADAGTLPTNHYSRAVHEVNIDHRGYAFPFDDVVPNEGMDQAGIVKDGRPMEFIVTVSGMGG